MQAGFPVKVTRQRCASMIHTVPASNDEIDGCSLHNPGTALFLHVKISQQISKENDRTTEEHYLTTAAQPLIPIVLLKLAFVAK
jgi:hypothetical protein